MSTIDARYCWKIVRPDELETPWLNGHGRSYSRFDRVAAHVEEWGQPVEITILSWGTDE